MTLALFHGPSRDLTRAFDNREATAQRRLRERQEPLLCRTPARFLGFPASPGSGSGLPLHEWLNLHD